MKQFLGLKSQSLRVRLTAGVVFAQTALAFVLLTAVVKNTNRSLDQSVEHQQTELNVVFRSAFVEPIVQRDFATLQAIIDELVAGGLISKVQIKSTQGKVLAESGKVSQETTKTIYDGTFLGWNNTQFAKNQTVISFDKRPLAQVDFTLDLERQIQQRSELISQYLLLGFCGALLTIALSLQFFSPTSKRLSRLVYFAQRIEEGQFTQRIPIDSADEIGRLGNSMNLMAESLAGRIEELVSSEREKASYLADSLNQKARLFALLDSIRIGIVFLDTAGKMIYANKAAATVWDNQIPYLYSAAGQSHVDERETSSGRLVCETCYPVYRETESTQPEASQEKYLIGSVWLFEDVTRERKAQQTIQYLAERDALTGLLNRRSFTEALDDTLRHSANNCALIFIDLDNFKLINDLHGHAQGDKVLLELAARLTSMTRQSDLVARLGGDEFVVLIRDMDPDHLDSWCDRLLLQLTQKERSLRDDSIEMSEYTTCSVGVALFPRDATQSQELIAAADQALYDAKRAGKNAWRAFKHDSERDAEKMQTMIWADRVNSALRNDGFEVFLQGVHRIEDRSVHHWEALVRMPDQSQTGKFFSPDLFIGHAERSGKILELDRWMVRNCIQILRSRPRLEPIAVNVSGITLSDPSFPLFVAEQLALAEVEGHRLHLELTETAALSDIQTAKTAVRALQDLGCSVCLDDFGAGFASLAYLKHIEASYLKIDGMFIKNLNSDHENQVLLRAIVDIAKHSGRLTVAEWVETEELLERVRSFGIDLAQGWLFSKPLPHRLVGLDTSSEQTKQAVDVVH